MSKVCFTESGDLRKRRKAFLHKAFLLFATIEFLLIPQRNWGFPFGFDIDSLCKFIHSSHFRIRRIIRQYDLFDSRGVVFCFNLQVGYTFVCSKKI